eukprot:g47432.t1
MVAAKDEEQEVIEVVQEEEFKMEEVGDAEKNQKVETVEEQKDVKAADEQEVIKTKEEEHAEVELADEQVPKVEEPALENNDLLPAADTVKADNAHFLVKSQYNFYLPAVNEPLYHLFY